MQSCFPPQKHTQSEDSNGFLPSGQFKGNLKFVCQVERKSIFMFGNHLYYTYYCFCYYHHSFFFLFYYSFGGECYFYLLLVLFSCVGISWRLKVSVGAIFPFLQLCSVWSILVEINRICLLQLLLHTYLSCMRYPSFRFRVPRWISAIVWMRSRSVAITPVRKMVPRN